MEPKIDDGEAGIEVQVERPVGSRKIEFHQLGLLASTVFKEGNMVYQGGEGIKDLPCCRVSIDGRATGTLSQWEMGWWDRMKFLFTGKLWLCALGTMHPPVALFIGDPFVQEKS